MNNKYIFISFNDSNADNLLLDKINETGNIAAYPVFKNTNKVFRAIRRISIEHDFSSMKLWFGSWFENISNADVLICIASRYSPYILNYIKKQNPGIRLINYYWDKIQISHYPIIKSQNFENWTFDRMDSKTYGLHFNPQFYVDTLHLPKNPLLYDICFVGADREGSWSERTSLVKQYYDILMEQGLKVFFYYVTKDTSQPYMHRNRISETQYVDIVSKSKAVLEIVQPGLEWITLRPLLALSNHKKVVSNNKLLTNEKYYSKSNIFILDNDNIETINDFIKSKFEEILEDNISYYSIENWVKRF